MSAFNVTDLLTATQTSSVNDEYINIPEGDYLAVLDEIKANDPFVSADGTERYSLAAKWKIQDESLQQTTKREANFVNQTIFLNLTEGGELDMDDNLMVGRMLTAFDMNDEGWSFAAFQGQTAMVNIKHTVSKKDSSIIYANVANVASA